MNGPVTVDCASVPGEGVSKSPKFPSCQVDYTEVPSKQLYGVCSESEDVSSSDEAVIISHRLHTNVGMSEDAHQDEHKHSHHHLRTKRVVEQPCIVISLSPHSEKDLEETQSAPQSPSWRDLTDSCQVMATELEEVCEDPEGEEKSTKKYRVRWSKYNIVHHTYSSSSYNRRTKERRYTEKEMAAVRQQLDDLHDELFPNRDYYIVGAPELLRDEPGAFEKVCTKFVNMYESSHDKLSRNINRLSQKTLIPSMSTSSFDSKHPAAPKRRWSVDASLLSFKGLQHTNVRASIDLAKLKGRGSLADAQTTSEKAELREERAKSEQSSPAPGPTEGCVYAALNMAARQHELTHSYIPPSALHAPHVPVRSSFEIRSALKQPHVAHPRARSPLPLPEHGTMSSPL